jgi:hypothetical protein
MKKSILEIYALSVCFVALVCFVVALGIAVYDLIQIASPAFTLNAYEYERHQSNQAYGRSPRLEMRGISPGIPLEPTEPQEEEQTLKREESYQAALRSERRRGTQSLTIVGIVMIIDLCVFAIHWLLSKKSRATI